MNFFHINLRYACKKFKVTQDSLAVYMKKTQTTIGNWQNGKSQPSLEELLALSNYFAIELTTLIAIDIEKNNLINEEHVARFRNRSPRKDIRKESIIKGIPVQHYEYRLPESQVSEEDKTTNWIVLKELRNLSQKLDHIKTSIDKMARNKTVK